MRKFLVAVLSVAFCLSLCLPLRSQEPDRSNAGPCTNPKLKRYPVSANSSGDSVLSDKFESLVHQIKDKKEEIGEGLLGKWQSTEYILRNIQDVRKRIAAFRAANVSTLTDVQTKTLDALNARLDAVQSKAA